MGKKQISSVHYLEASKLQSKHDPWFSQANKSILITVKLFDLRGMIFNFFSFDPWVTKKSTKLQVNHTHSTYNVRSISIPLFKMEEYNIDSALLKGFFSSTCFKVNWATTVYVKGWSFVAIWLFNMPSENYKFNT